MLLNTVLANLPNLVDDSQNRAASVPSVETVGSFTRAAGFIGEGSSDITGYSVRMANIYCKFKIRKGERLETFQYILPPPQCHGN